MFVVLQWLQRLSSVDSHPVWYAGVVVLWYSVVSQLLATVLGTL